MTLAELQDALNARYPNIHWLVMDPPEEYALSMIGVSARLALLNRNPDAYVYGTASFPRLFVRDYRGDLPGYVANVVVHILADALIGKKDPRNRF